MGHCRLFETLTRPGLLLAVSLLAGCVNYTAGTIPIRAARPLSVSELPGQGLAGGKSAAPSSAASHPAPARRSHASATSPPSPIVLAMVRAGSYYERGIQAMQDGNADQAEWEFDAAFEALLNSNLTGQPSPRLLDGPPPLASLPSAWLFQISHDRERDAQTDAAVEPDEPNQDATALLSPEDLRAVAQEADGEAAPVPEPEFRQYDLPVVLNDQVKTFIQYFSSRKWGVVSRAFERARQYQPMMQEIFREKGLPEDLINLAFIESAMNPWATSKAKAAGIWQFIPSTGRLFNMRVGWWLDERRDPEKSTRGAAEYLKKLYQMFQSWPLALAAYNAGEGAIQRAIDRQKTRDFWELRLPKETQLFVPAIMAMTVISRDPSRFGFTVPPPEPRAADTVVLHHPTDLKLIAKAARASVEQIRELNPALIRWATPPDQSRFAVRVPAGLKQAVESELSQIDPARRLTLIRHRVRKGETSAAIAKRHGVSHQALLDMNGLVKRQPLKVGSLVAIPDRATGLHTAAAVEAPAARNGSTASASKTPRKAASRYTVKSGDTLGGIAKTHKVSVENLRQWNALAKGAPLRPGQHLHTSPPAESRGSTVAVPSPRAKAKAPLASASKRPTSR